MGYADALPPGGLAAGGVTLGAPSIVWYGWRVTAPARGQMPAGLESAVRNTHVCDAAGQPLGEGRVDPRVGGWPWLDLGAAGQDPARLQNTTAMV